MTMTVLGRETITVVHAVLVQDTFDHSESRDWANATRTDVPFCNVQPFKLSSRLVKEDSLQREWMSEYYRVWMPAGTEIEFFDRMEWRGKVMEVFGDEQPWHTFAGVEHHIQLLGLVLRG